MTRIVVPILPATLSIHLMDKNVPEQLPTYVLGVPWAAYAPHHNSVLNKDYMSQTYITFFHDLSMFDGKYILKEISTFGSIPAYDDTTNPYTVVSTPDGTVGGFLRSTFTDDDLDKPLGITIDGTDTDGGTQIYLDMPGGHILFGTNHRDEEKFDDIEYRVVMHLPTSLNTQGSLIEDSTSLADRSLFTSSFKVYIIYDSGSLTGGSISSHYKTQVKNNNEVKINNKWFTTQMMTNVVDGDSYDDTFWTYLFANPSDWLGSAYRAMAKIFNCGYYIPSSGLSSLYIASWFSDQILASDITNNLGGAATAIGFDTVFINLPDFSKLQTVDGYNGTFAVGSDGSYKNVPLSAVNVEYPSEVDNITLSIDSDSKNKVVAKVTGAKDFVLFKDITQSPKYYTFYMGGYDPSEGYRVSNVWYTGAASNPEGSPPGVDVIFSGSKEVRGIYLDSLQYDGKGLVYMKPTIQPISNLDDFFFVAVVDDSQVVKNIKDEFLFSSDVELNDAYFDYNVEYNIVAHTMNPGDFGGDSKRSNPIKVVVPEISRAVNSSLFYQEGVNRPLSGPYQSCYPALVVKGIGNTVDKMYVDANDYGNQITPLIKSLHINHYGIDTEIKTDIWRVAVSNGSDTVTIPAGSLPMGYLDVGDSVVIADYQTTTGEAEFFNAVVDSIYESAGTLLVSLDKYYTGAPSSTQYMYKYSPITFGKEYNSDSVMLDTEIYIISKDGFKSNKLLVELNDVDDVGYSTSKYGLSFMCNFVLDRERVESTTENFQICATNIKGFVYNNPIVIPEMYVFSENGYGLSVTVNDLCIETNLGSLNVASGNPEISWIGIAPKSSTAEGVMGFAPNYAFLGSSDDVSDTLRAEDGTQVTLSSNDVVIIGSPIAIHGLFLYTNIEPLEIETSRGSITITPSTGVHGIKLETISAIDKGSYPESVDTVFKSLIPYDPDLYYVVIRNSGLNDVTIDWVSILSEGINLLKIGNKPRDTYDLETGLVDGYQAQDVLETYKLSSMESLLHVYSKPLTKKVKTVNINGTAYTKDTSGKFTDISNLKLWQEHCYNGEAYVSLVFDNSSEVYRGYLMDLNIKENAGQMVAEWSAKVVVVEV